MACYMRLYKFFFHSTTIVRQGEATKLGYFLDGYGFTEWVYKDTGRLNVQTACIFIAYAEKCTAHLRIQALSLIRPKVQYRPQPVGRILESDTCSQNKTRTSLWPMAKRRIQESELRAAAPQKAVWNFFQTASLSDFNSILFAYKNRLNRS